MKRAVVIAIMVVLTIVAGAVLFVRVAAGGFSAKAEPTSIEKLVARTTRRLAVPSGVRSRQNPTPDTDEVLGEARAHWADHCAACHANNGGGDTEMGRNLYPRAPDMRKSDTQDLSDGELFFIIENGVRLTGMPGWGTGNKKSEEASWKLVRFVRHLPKVSDDEIQAMKDMNPRTPAEFEEEKAVEEFLKGDDSRANQHAHSH